ncbi:MAG: EAL domain-containing protein [Acidimicrobiales bacterium]
MAPRTTDAGPLHVQLFATLLVALCGLLLEVAPAPPAAPSIGPWAALVLALYAGAELWSVEIEFRNDTHTFTFTSVPLVIGLLLLPVPLVAALRVLSSLVVLAGVHRQGGTKLAVNLTSHTLEVLVAGAVMGAFGLPPGLGPGAWPVVAVAVVGADLTGGLVVTIAISLFQRSWDRSFLAGVWPPLVVAAIDSSYALHVATELRASSAEVWLLLPLGAFAVVLTHRFARLANRYRSMLRLDTFARELGQETATGDFEARLLARVAEVMHAEQAWLCQPADGWRTLLTGQGEVVTSGLSPFDAAVAPRLAQGDPELIGIGGPLGRDLASLGVEQAIVGPLLLPDGTLLVLGVGDRAGAVRDFDADDVRIFGTICAHAAVAARNLALIEELRAESTSLEYQATHDPLTGLANRTLFTRHLEAVRPGTEVAVLLIDLERFKEVNDTLGHACGDQLLVEIGRRLQPVLQGGELLARLGGDEFVLQIMARGEVDAAERARLVLDHLRAPYALQSVDVDVDASVGIALATAPLDPDELMRRADVAMYNAKTAHTGVEVYGAERDHYSPKRLAMAARLRSAIDGGRIQLHYQPQIDLATGQLVAVEALARWHDPGRGQVPPAEFVEVAERTDLIHPLTDLVLQLAVGQAAAWYRAGHPLRVAVNVSARNLTEADLVPRIRRMLDSAGLPPHLLEVELTETTIMANAALAAAVMTQLRAMNLRVAIDDFGTGHSSLSHLTSLPLDKLKIDRSFTQGLGVDATAETVVRAIVDLGRSLKLDVVAEGVETEEARVMLEQMACQLGQGYLFSRPAPAADLERWWAGSGTAGVAGGLLLAEAGP